MVAGGAEAGSRRLVWAASSLRDHSLYATTRLKRPAGLSTATATVSFSRRGPAWLC